MAGLILSGVGLVWFNSIKKFNQHKNTICPDRAVMNERYNLVQNVFILLWNAPFFKSEFSDKCFGYDFCNNYTLKKVDLSFEIRDVIAWKYTTDCLRKLPQ